jgi:voltage-gated potassium channel Kch
VPTRVSEARGQGLPVFYGDASRLEVQRALGEERARPAVVIMDNADTASRTVALMHHRYPTLDIFVRATTVTDGRSRKPVRPVSCIRPSS